MLLGLSTATSSTIRPYPPSNTISTSSSSLSEEEELSDSISLPSQTKRCLRVYWLGCGLGATLILRGDSSVTMFQSALWQSMVLGGIFSLFSSSFWMRRGGLRLSCAALRHMSSKTMAILLSRSSTAIMPLSRCSRAFSCCLYWRSLSSSCRWSCSAWYCSVMVYSLCRSALSLLIFSSSFLLSYNCCSLSCQRRASYQAYSCLSLLCSSSSYLRSSSILACSYLYSCIFRSLASYFLRRHSYSLPFCSQIFVRRYSASRFFNYYACLFCYYCLRTYSSCLLLSSYSCRSFPSFSLAICCNFSSSTLFLSSSLCRSSSWAFLLSSSSLLRCASSSLSLAQKSCLICSSSMSSPCYCSSSLGNLPGVCFRHLPLVISTANCSKDPTDSIQEESSLSKGRRCLTMAPVCRGQVVLRGCSARPQWEANWAASARSRQNQSTRMWSSLEAYAGVRKMSSLASSPYSPQTSMICGSVCCRLWLLSSASESALSWRDMVWTGGMRVRSCEKLSEEQSFFTKTALPLSEQSLCSWCSSTIASPFSNSSTDLPQSWSWSYPTWYSLRSYSNWARETQSTAELRTIMMMAMTATSTPVKKRQLRDVCMQEMQMEERMLSALRIMERRAKTQQCLNTQGAASRAERWGLCAVLENLSASSLKEKMRPTIAMERDAHRLSCFYHRRYCLSAWIRLFHRMNCSTLKHTQTQAISTGAYTTLAQGNGSDRPKFQKAERRVHRERDRNQKHPAIAYRKRGENILGKLCLRRKETIISIRMAIRKGKGTGMLSSAPAMADPFTISLQEYELSIVQRAVHWMHWLPAQVRQRERAEQSGERQYSPRDFVLLGQEDKQLKEKSSSPGEQVVQAG